MRTSVGKITTEDDSSNEFFLIEAFDVGDSHGDRAGEAGVSAIVFDLGGLARLAMHGGGQPILVGRGKRADGGIPAGTSFDNQ